MSLQSGPSESNLAPVAKEVLPYLYKIHEKLGENVSKINGTLRGLANELIAQGLLPESERMSPLELKRKGIDFKTELARLKSILIIEEEKTQAEVNTKNERGILIIENFIDKLESMVLDIPGVDIYGSEEQAYENDSNG